MSFTFSNCSKAFKNLSNSIAAGEDEPGSEPGYPADTTLRLGFVGSSSLSPASKVELNLLSSIDGSFDVKGAFPICLGLGHPSYFSDHKGSSIIGCTTVYPTKETEKEPFMDLEQNFSIQVGSEKAFDQKKISSPGIIAADSKQKIDLELGLLSGPADSVLTIIQPSPLPQNVMLPLTDDEDLVMDEGSMASPSTMRNSNSQLQNSLDVETSLFLNQPLIELKPTSEGPHFESSIIATPSLVTCISSTSRNRKSAKKTCQSEGCQKWARGASRFCIFHGGGRRCQRPDCGNGAVGLTYCKAHGGGKRCSWGHPGSGFGEGDGVCNSSVSGKTALCSSHGALVLDTTAHGGALVGALVQASSFCKPEKLVTLPDLNLEIEEAHGLLPRARGSSSVSFTVPEGRVHGGNLLASVADNSDGPSRVKKARTVPEK